jgi:hypothetical protein
MRCWFTVASEIEFFPVVHSGFHFQLPDLLLGVICFLLV